MVKIGILSMQRIANYGSFLQAYGLKRILEELGCEVQFVDYHPGKTLIPADSGTGIKRKLIKLLKVIQYRAPFIEKMRYIKYKKEYAKNYYRYLEIDHQMNYNPVVDLLIIGSDEVFNCVQDNTNVGYSPELFGVGNKAKRLITYAASFGNTTIEKLERYHVIDEITGWFHKFHAISVRDENTRSIVEKLTGTMPESHLDPVLIYDFLLKEDIPKAVKEKDYLLLYGYSGRFTKAECSAIRSYAKEKNLKILYIGGVQQCYGRFIDCSPFEVLAYFKNATAVVTDTFHGSIFSIITHSNFAVFIRSAGYGNAEKVRDLLRRLKLENRIITEMQGIDSVLSVFPVYEETDRIIENERTKAYKYLQEEVYLCTQN